MNGIILLFIVPAVIVGLIIFFIVLFCTKGEDFFFKVLGITGIMAILFFLSFALFNRIFYPEKQIQKQYTLINDIRNETWILDRDIEKAKIQLQEGGISQEEFNQLANELKAADSRLQKARYSDYRKIIRDYANVLFKIIAALNFLIVIAAFIVRRNKVLMVSLLLFSVLLLIFNYTNDFLM